MRLSITPLGATGSSSAGVAAAIVDYLEGARRDPGAALFASGAWTATAYYADSREGPGRWLGAGAAFQRLGGVVDRDAFQRVLDGRHPQTGARLVTAQGSSQRGHLAVGTAAGFDADGEALYSLADAARVLCLRRVEVEELVEAGRDGDREHGDRGWLDTLDGPTGPLVPDREIARHLEFAATPVTAAEVLAEGDPDDWLTTPAAARLLGVTRQYVRRLCDAHLQAGPEADRGRRAALACRRDGDGPGGRYLVRRRDLADFAAGRKPPVARVGFDVTLTCEKSIGLLALLSGPEQQPAVLEALRVANDTAVGHLDRVASCARKRGRTVRTEGLVVASYLHGTSRALDPHPHHHNVVANAVVDADGDVRTLDARALYRHAPAATALANVAVRWELRHLNVGWWQRDDGQWEVAGIDQAAIDEFSQRHSAIDEVKNALEERLGRTLTGSEDGTVGLSTRPGKAAVDPAELLADWRQRAAQVGLDIASCFERQADRAIGHDTLPNGDANRLFADLVHPTAGLCATSTTFDRGDVLAMIADWSITDGNGVRRKVLLPPAEVERLADRFLASNLVVELLTVDSGTFRRTDGTAINDGQHQPLFATVELLETEAEIMRRYHTGRAVGAGQVTADHLHLLNRTFDGGLALSDEQRRLVEIWCTSGHRLQAAVGRAGTGKTTTMRAATTVWRHAGYRVVGCAVKGEAARQLAEDADIHADTVALLLTRADAGQVVLDARTVLIVDEASTLGDRDLLAICRLADTSGATVRLIGDPAQHASVPAGGSFAHLVATHPNDTPELTEVRRLRNPGERRRADLVRSGRVDQALDELQASGQLVLTDSDGDTYASMLERWYDHRNNGCPHPMVHGRNRQRRMLNQLAQSMLAADGEIDLELAVMLADGRRLAVGDEVIARHGDRGIHPAGDPAAWMRNGTTGRIIAIRQGADPTVDSITIRTPSGDITCPRAVFDRRRGGIDLGYAVTSYAVQGSTRDTSTSAVTTATSRSELYVDMTRGRHNNQLYATRRSANLDDDHEAHLPRLDADTVPALRTTLARRSALVLDPDALHASQLRHGRVFAGLLAAQRRGDPGPIDAATVRATNAIRRQATTTPSPVIRHVLPARPTCPHLAARWDDTAGDVAVHIASARRPLRSGPSPIERVLGLRPGPGDSRTRWDELSHQVVDLAIDIASWNLARHSTTDSGRTDGDGWMHTLLEQLAHTGRLATLDVPALQVLVRDVDSFRRRRHIDDNSSILGSVPNDATQRVEHVQLSRRIAGRRTPSAQPSIA